ncbi:hypothetical protein [Streptomyces sp. NBC_00572]|uniref:hypothetical protein n=1 Tax=Streptomyces sp. NBC_00572 TaxID=2903664 RepID=UPI0022525AEF|nr:hypothetical protein [Streptomyces sp. NBC_00572]MCX4985830.1 hypothetical protein [Streptomyces sp. NBC_00572]
MDGTARGGGVRVGPFGTLDLTDSHITGNTVDAPNGTAQGDGLYHAGGTTGWAPPRCRRTPSPSTRAGDGIFKASGVLILNGDVIRNNQPNNCSPAGAVPGCTG